MNGSPSDIPGGDLLNTDKQILTDVEAMFDEAGATVPKIRGKEEWILNVHQSEDSLFIIHQQCCVYVESNSEVLNSNIFPRCLNSEEMRQKTQVSAVGE